MQRCRDPQPRLVIRPPNDHRRGVAVRQRWAGDVHRVGEPVLRQRFAFDIADPRGLTNQPSIGAINPRHRRVQFAKTMIDVPPRPPRLAGPKMPHDRLDRSWTNDVGVRPVNVVRPIDMAGYPLRHPAGSIDVLTAQIHPLPIVGQFFGELPQPLVEVSGEHRVVFKNRQALNVIAIRLLQHRQMRAKAPPRCRSGSPPCRHDALRSVTASNLRGCGQPVSRPAEGQRCSNPAHRTTSRAKLMTATRSTANFLGCKSSIGFALVLALDTTVEVVLSFLFVADRKSVKGPQSPPQKGPPTPKARAAATATDACRGR